MDKDFDKWAVTKKIIDKKRTVPFIKERDIYWCSIGINVGDEENGKSILFSRPVLVFKKFSASLFWGIPLSSKIKDNPYYLQISFKDTVNSAMISHLRLYDGKRLNVRLCRLGRMEYVKVIKVVENLIPKLSGENVG